MMVYLVMLTLGCADECTAAIARKEVAVESCGIVAVEDFQHECSEEYVELLECEADCLEAASCDSIVGGRGGVGGLGGELRRVTSSVVSTLLAVIEVFVRSGCVPFV